MLQEHYDCDNCCTEVTVISKGLNKAQVIADIVDGKPTLVILHTHKKVCRCCEKGIKYDSPYGSKRTASMEFDRHIVKTVLSDINMRNNAFENYGISNSYVNALVNNSTKRLLDGIETVEPCDQIILYPFYYDGTERCCVCGRRVYTNDTVLLSILPNYNAETILKFLLKKAPFLQKIEDIHCDLHPEVFDMLHSLMAALNEEGETYVITQRIIDAAMELRDTEHSLYITDFSTQINNFIDIIRKQKEYNYRIPTMLQSWWIRLRPDSLKRRIKPLWDKVEPCLSGCYTHSNFDDDEVHEVLGMIECLRVRGKAYDTMVRNMLFTIPAIYNRTLSRDDVFLKCVTGSKLRLYNFYVEISALKQVFACDYDPNTDPSTNMHEQILQHEEDNPWQN